MACNCLCCGCQNCTEGQEGKCCCGGPSGECCQPGEFCCNGVCLEGGCEGACCVDGECSITSQADCSGVWQGPNTTCEDGDCADECCVPEDGDCGTFLSVSRPSVYYNCRQGYFESTCLAAEGTTGNCDPAGNSADLEGCITCEGLPSQVTVTVSGAVLTTGANAAFQPYVDACNAAFVIDLDCCGQAASSLGVLATVSVTYLGFTFTANISVAVGFNGGLGGQTSATLTITEPGGAVGNGASVNITTASGTMPVSKTSCGGYDIRDCSGFAASGNSSYANVLSPVDFSGATIAVA